MATPEDPTTRRVATAQKALYRGTIEGGGWCSAWMRPKPHPFPQGNDCWDRRPARDVDWLESAAGTHVPDANLAIAICKNRSRPRDAEDDRGTEWGPRTVILDDVDPQPGEPAIVPVDFRSEFLWALPHRLIEEAADPAVEAAWPVLTPAHVPWLVVAQSPGGRGIHLLAHAAQPLPYGDCTRRVADRLELLAMTVDARVGGGWHHDRLMTKTRGVVRVIGGARHAETSPEKGPQGPNAGAVLDLAGNLVRGDALADVLERAVASSALAICALSDCWTVAHAAFYSHRHCPEPIPIVAHQQNWTAFRIASAMLTGFGMEPTPESAAWCADQILDLFVFADDATATKPQWEGWYRDVHRSARSAADILAAGGHTNGCLTAGNRLCRHPAIGKHCSEPSGPGADAGAGAGAPQVRTHLRLATPRTAGTTTQTPTPTPTTTSETATVLADTAVNLDPPNVGTPPPDSGDPRPPAGTATSTSTSGAAVDAAGPLRAVPKRKKTDPQLFTSRATPLSLADGSKYLLVWNRQTGEQATISFAGPVLTVSGVDYRVDVDHCQKRWPVYHFVRDAGRPVKKTLETLVGDKRSERRTFAVALGLRDPEIWQQIPDTGLSLLQAIIERVARPFWHPEHDVLTDAAYDAVWKQAPGPAGAERRAAIGRDGVPLRIVLDAFRKATGEKNVLTRVELFFAEWPTDASGRPRYGVRSIDAMCVTIDPIDPERMEGAPRRAGEKEDRLDTEGEHLEPSEGPATADADDDGDDEEEESDF